eukprot:UN02847
MHHRASTTVWYLSFNKFIHRSWCPKSIQDFSVFLSKSVIVPLNHFSCRRM